MKRLKPVSILIIFTLLLSSLTILSIKASGPLFKVYFTRENATKEVLILAGASIIEDYGCFVLVNLPQTSVDQLRNKGFDVQPCTGYDTVQINNTRLHPDQDKILMPETAIPENLQIGIPSPGDYTYFIFQFIGPIKEEWKKFVSGCGGTIVGTLNQNALIVKATPSVATSIKDFEKVTGGTPIHPFYKIGDNIAPDEKGNIQLDVSLYQGESPEAVAKRLPFEITFGDNTQNGNLIVKCTIDDIETITRDVAVSNIGRYAPREIFMDYSREIMGIQARTANSSPPLSASSTGVWDMGLKGKGETVCVQDTGCDTGNLVTLNTDYGTPPRVVGHFGYNDYPYMTYSGPDPDQSKPWNDVHGHGTFVAGQVLGNGGHSNGQYAGVAPEANLIVQRGLGFMNPGLPDSYKLGARVHTNSWGSSWNTYDSECQYVDWFVRENPDMVVTIAAGNSGPYAGTTGIPSTSKNAICVGAAGNDKPNATLAANANVGTTTLQVGSTTGFSNGMRVCIVGNNSPAEDEYCRVTGTAGGPPRIFITPALTFTHNSGLRVHGNHAEAIARFSSRGPTEDGRIKPDIMAPGQNVTGIRLGSPPYYSFDWNGTSMATPNLAGCAALTRQWFRERQTRLAPSAAVVKAMLINGARNVREDYNGTALYYPNTNSGWGYVDLYKTLYPANPTVRRYYDYKKGIWTGQKIDFPIMAGPGTFKATLVWTDFYSVPGANPHLVNNLDLVVTSPGGANTYWGNQFNAGTSESTPNPTATDELNNVEGVTLNNSTYSGQYTVSVVGSNILQGPQPFALVVQYESTRPDFTIRAYPESRIVQTNMDVETFKLETKSLNGFSGHVQLSVSFIDSELNAKIQSSKAFLTSGSSSITFMDVFRKLPLKIGKYYVIVRATSGSLYHEDIVELIVRPAKNYRFDFRKGVSKYGFGSYTDDGKPVALGSNLYYALNYDPTEKDHFSKLYVDDIIPTGTNYTGTAFPKPTHYSPDNGGTWINSKPPANAGNGYRLRWALHEIEGSGRLMKLSNGVPGMDNISENTGSSSRSVMKIGSDGNIYVCWQDSTTGNPDNTEIFFRKWNGTQWVRIDGTPGVSNISNTGNFSSYVDMVLDSNNNPHFVWVENWTAGWQNHYQILYTRWDGTQLVTANGTPGYENITASMSDLNYYLLPRIALFNDMPNIVFGNSYSYTTPRGLYFTKWNGTQWTTVTGAPGIELVSNTGSAYPYGISIGINTQGQPHFVYETIRYMWWFIMQDDLRATKWSGSTWTGFNGTTPVFEYLMPNNRLSHSYPNIAMQGDIPHVVWSDDGVGLGQEIVYSKYANGAWRAANDSAGYDILTMSTDSDITPHIALLPGGLPAVIWNSQKDGIGDIYFRWFKNGWSNLLSNGPIEKITESDSDSTYPQVAIASDGTPYFAMSDNKDNDYDVYVTYPIMDFTTSTFPGQIVWGAKIAEQVDAGQNSITNKATMRGILDTLEYTVETDATESVTVNPLSIGLEFTKKANPSTVALNQTILYTMKVSNTGTVALNNVLIQDVLPKGMVIVKTQPSAIATPTGAKWQISRLGAGQSYTVRLWAKVVDATYVGKQVINKATAGTSGVLSVEDYASVLVLQDSTGFPEADFDFVLKDKEVKAGSETIFDLTIWNGNGPFSYNIDWGDKSGASIGNIEENKPLQVSHSFQQTGEYEVTCTITDRYNKQATKHVKAVVK